MMSDDDDDDNDMRASGSSGVDPKARWREDANPDWEFAFPFSPLVLASKMKQLRPIP